MPRYRVHPALSTDHDSLRCVVDDETGEILELAEGEWSTEPAKAERIVAMLNEFARL